MLPVTNGKINLSTPIEFQDYPTHTFYIDPISKQVSGKEDGLTAMIQAVQVIFGVERFQWQIYTPNFGIEWDGLIGAEYGFVTSEIKRRVQEAFIPDNRIYGASDFVFKLVDTNTIVCTLTVNTVYGDFRTQLEVKL